MDFDDEVEKVVSEDGVTRHVSTLNVKDGLPLELTLFRRIVVVSGGHTEGSAQLKAHNDCLKFCYYYNRLDPFQAIGMVSDA